MNTGALCVVKRNVSASICGVHCGCVKVITVATVADFAMAIVPIPATKKYKSHDLYWSIVIS